MNRFKFLLAAIGLLFAVSACSTLVITPTVGTETPIALGPTVEATLEATATVVPTDTPRPTETATLVLSPAATVTETPTETVTPTITSTVTIDMARTATAQPTPKAVIIGGQVDPCSLLLAAEVGRAAGDWFNYPTRTTVPGTVLAACVYSTARSYARAGGATAPRTVTVQVFDLGGIAPPNPVTVPPGPNGPFPVSGVGDSADWIQFGSGGALNVRKGRWGLGITLDGYDAQAGLAIAKTIALLAVPRLP